MNHTLNTQTCHYLKMKPALLLLFCLSAYGQVLSPSPPPPNLPPYVLGAGASWERGSTSQLAVDITLAVLLKGTSFFWWSDIATPLAKGINGQPVPSTITTGGAWVATSNSRIALVVIIMGGFSIAAPAQSSAVGSTVAPAFSGSIGVPIKITGNWAVMPYIKALATSATSTTPAGVSTVIQPGLQVQYNFPAPAVTQSKSPTVKMMRSVFKRVGLEYPER